MTPGAAALSMHGVSSSVSGRTLVCDVDLDVSPGEVVGLLGPSGAGKSTVMAMAAGTRLASTGTVSVLGSGRYRARSEIGWIPQMLALIEHSSAAVNIASGLIGQHSLAVAVWLTARAGARDDVRSIAEELELGDHLRAPVKTLSGGERQRVAVARALVRPRRLVLADEPISALNHELATTVMDLLRRTAISGSAVLCSLHDEGVAARFCDRVVRLHRR